MGGGASSVAPEDHVPHQNDVNEYDQRGPGKRRSRGCCGCFSMERYCISKASDSLWPFEI